MNQIDLHTRAAIVTGAARGIGLAVARRLLQSGASVALWDRDVAAVEQARTQLAPFGPVQAFVVDITDLAAVQRATEATSQGLGRIDILVNNAGIAGRNAPLWEADPADWRRVIEINLLGPFHCCRAVIPHMLKLEYGRIVNVASVAGKEGNPNAAHYSASKAAVMAMTKSLGKELATRGIVVNCVTPAVIETDILLQLTPQHVQYMLSKIPMNRFGKTDEAAAMIAWLCSEECSFSTGAVFDLSGGRATY